MKPPYQLIALDVDGTVENSHHELTERTAEAIRAAAAQGVHVVLTTGKQYFSVAGLVERLGLTSPQITTGGAVVTDPTTKRLLYEQRLDPAIAQRVVHMANEEEATLVLVRDDMTITPVVNRDVEYMLSYGDPYPLLVPDLAAALEPPPMQITLIYYQQDERYEAAYLHYKAAFDGSLNVNKSSPYYLELTHPTVSKGTALAQLAQQLGIAPEQVMAVGDSFNDLSMFAYAGLAVAMGQSKPAIQQAAHAITTSNDEDGVALAIERYILNGDSHAH